MALLARLALLVLLLTVTVVGAVALNDQPGDGAVEAPLCLDGADADDAADALLGEWTQPHFPFATPPSGSSDLDGPEGPPPPLADHPPNV